MVVYGFICPKCNHNKYLKEYEEDQLYICEKCKEPIMFHCDNCEEMYYSMNRLGSTGDVYTCKKCGKIQWGYTQWMRDKK